MGRELANPNGKAGTLVLSALKEILLKPKLEHPQGIESGDIRNSEKIADEIPQGIPPAEPKPCRAHAGALPVDQLFKVHRYPEIQQAGVNRSLLKTSSRIPPNFRRIAGRNFHALVFKSRANAPGLTPVECERAFVAGQEREAKRLRNSGCSGP